ncbi:MAG TPA: carbohydrate ABC transporter permease [Nitrososphaerales archaeon]|nr:carbohydrate ABC transporter permease [Nitrososphaerales archaeon]
MYSAWPLLVMGLEGYSIDLSPFFAGRGVRLVGGVPFYSGGVFPSPIHYLDALVIGAFPRLVANSLIIAFISISIALAVGIPVAYILARVEIKGKNIIAYLLLALRTISPFVVIVPLYITYSRIGLYDTYPGISLAEDMLVLSVVVWMLRGFFADIPKDVYDAASIFGNTEAQVFRRVVLPMVIPGIVVTALFALVLIWNEFLIAVTLTGPSTKTVAVGVWTGMTENQVNYRSVNWDDLNAAGTLAFAPAVAVMLSIRKYLAKGFSLGTAR